MRREEREIASADANELYADADLLARDFAICAAMSQPALSSVMSTMIPCEMTQ